MIGSGLGEIWRMALDGDGRLPPETELADLLGVGRNSVREALIRLEAEGFISRRHGAGTFANPAAMDVQVRVDRTSEFAEVISGLGMTPHVELIEAGWVEPPAEILERLDIGDDVQVFRTCKRWLADGVPVMFAEDFIPATRRVTIDAARSVLEIARIAGGQSTEWVSSRIEACLAGESGAYLDVEHGRPILRFEQVGVSRNGRRCWLACEYHRGNSGPRPLRYGLVRTVLHESEEDRGNRTVDRP